jgi:hypothetical protein
MRLFNLLKHNYGLRVLPQRLGKFSIKIRTHQSPIMAEELRYLVLFREIRHVQTKHPAGIGEKKAS